MTTKVGFVGLGTMGRAIAENDVRAGFDVMVYDLRDEPVREMEALGATRAGSAREVGQHAEIVQLAVPDDAAVEASVLGKDGVLARAKAGTVIVIHSTIHPRTAQRVGEQARPNDVAVLDAQITGAQVGARTQSLTFMVGGDAAAFERARPVLAASGREIFHMGELGAGAMTKGAQQAMTCINVMAAMEGFRFAERAKIDRAAFCRVLSASTAQSYVIDHQMGLGERHGEGVERRPFHRGLKAVLAMAFDLDVPMPAAALAQQTIPWGDGG
ncbi:MAG: NAD-binding protein [Chloroflexi bacterium]|nr:NAD-binding protein [Chloroflexota bacterium]